MCFTKLIGYCSTFSNHYSIILSSKKRASGTQGTQISDTDTSDQTSVDTTDTRDTDHRLQGALRLKVCNTPLSSATADEKVRLVCCDRLNWKVLGRGPRFPLLSVVELNLLLFFHVHVVSVFLHDVRVRVLDMLRKF